MANHKTDRTGRYQIKANPEIIRAFDAKCRKAGTNRSARLEILMQRDVTPIVSDQEYKDSQAAIEAAERETE